MAHCCAAAVAGIRQTLIARASIKGEFRIEQTMVRASGNNPLKFSAGDDDAMAALLGIGRRNAMPGGPGSGRGAATTCGCTSWRPSPRLQSAVRALLAQFDPANGIDKGARLRRARQDTRASARPASWDAFTAMHAKVSQALSDDFDSVFGKAFARAYEQAMHDATAGKDRTYDPPPSSPCSCCQRLLLSC